MCLEKLVLQQVAVGEIILKNVNKKVPLLVRLTGANLKLLDNLLSECGIHVLVRF